MARISEDIYEDIEDRVEVDLNRLKQKVLRTWELEGGEDRGQISPYMMNNVHLHCVVLLLFLTIWVYAGLQCAEYYTTNKLAH